MDTFDLVQGSDEWKAFRKEHFPASEYPMVMGDAKYMKRADYMNSRKYGTEKEFSDFQLALFAKGHAAEAAFLPIMEEIIGDELYPVTGRLEGTKLSASFDGLTMSHKQAFEHKLWNEKLAADIRSYNEGNTSALHQHYTRQLDQQLVVSGAEKVWFVTSDGTRNKFEMCEYTTIVTAEEIQDNWDNFMDELEVYEEGVSSAPQSAKPPAAAIMELPAIFIDITGGISNTNIDQYKFTALEFIGKINRELTTDEHFVDAENMVKFCNAAEGKLKKAKSDAISKTADIEAVFNTIDEIGAALRETRLELGKLVKTRKEDIKRNMIMQGELKVMDVITIANDKLEPYALGMSMADMAFTNAIKGKRSLVAMQQAIDEQAAKLTVQLNEDYELISRNANIIKEKTMHFEYIFTDGQALIRMDTYALSQLIDERLEKERARLQDAEDAQIAATKLAADNLAAEQAAEATVEVETKTTAVELTEEVIKTTSKQDTQPKFNFHEDVSEWAEHHKISLKALNALYDVFKKHNVGEV